MLDNLIQVLFTVDGPRANLIFNRPEQLNALSPTLISEALRVTQAVASDKALRVLVVRGAGRAFSAGVDLKAAAAPGHDRKAFGANARALLSIWTRMPQPVIAVVEGYCLAGGLSVALAADFILCSTDAQFADTHAKMGLKSSWGTTQRLPRLIGLQRAREMSFTGRRINGEEARTIGLALDAVAPSDLEGRIDALVQGIVEASSGSVAAYKDLYRQSQSLGLDAGLELEATAYYPIDDRKERLRASATERTRKP